MSGLHGLDDRTLAQATCRFGERVRTVSGLIFARLSCAWNQEAKKIARPVFLPFTQLSDRIQSDHNWNSACPGDSAASRGLATTADASSLHRRRAIGFLDSGPADRARVAEAYTRAAMPARDHLSGLPISKISRRLCLADWRAAKAFSLKVGCSVTIAGWYLLLQNIMQVNHRAVPIIRPRLPTRISFRPKVSKSFLLCSTTAFYWQISFIRDSCTGVQTPTSL